MNTENKLVSTEKYVFDHPTFDNSDIQGGVTLTQSVNSGTNLVLGSCCCSKIEFTLLNIEGKSTRMVSEFAYYDDGYSYFTFADGDTFGFSHNTKFAFNKTDSLIGIFLIEKPEIINDSKTKMVCYDRMRKFDRNVDGLSALSSSKTLRELLTALCNRCGVPLSSAPFPNENFRTRPTDRKNLKGRDVLSWIAQIAGCFAKMNRNGYLVLETYSDSGKELTRANYQTVRLSDYSIDPITKLIVYTGEDNYETFGSGDKAYVIKDNPLLYGTSYTNVEMMAENILYNLLDFPYTPFESDILDDLVNVNVGDIITISTRNNQNVKSIIMNKTTKGMKASISSTGDYEQEL